MPFLAETGDGLADANSYSDITFADDHHSLRGNALWGTFDDGEKQAALVRATDYIDKRFGSVFRGRKLQRQQALEWPRLNAYDDDDFWLDGIPRNLQKATVEYALRALIYNTLAPDAIRAAPDQDFSEEDYERDLNQSTGEVSQRTRKVGPISTSIQYRSTSKTSRESDRANTSGLVGAGWIPEYPEADMWLEELTEAGGAMVKMARGD